MKASLQFDPSLDVLGNRLPNVFIEHSKTGESLFTDQIESGWPADSTRPARLVIRACDWRIRA